MTNVNINAGEKNHYGLKYLGGFHKKDGFSVRPGGGDKIEFSGESTGV